MGVVFNTENIFEEVLLIRERFKTWSGNRHTLVTTHGTITDQVFARSVMGVCLRRNGAGKINVLINGYVRVLINFSTWFSFSCNILKSLLYGE